MASMNLKTYRAGSMAEALTEVKKDLGKNAVILHTRAYKVGSVLGVGGRQVIEITAADEVSARGPKIKPQVAVSKQVEPGFVPTRFQPPGQEQPSNSPPEAPLVQTMPLRVDDVAPRPTKPTVPSPSVVPPSAPRPALGLRAPFRPVDADTAGQLHEELASIKRLVGQVLQCSRATAANTPLQHGGQPSATRAAVAGVGGMSEPLFAQYMKLQDAEVGLETADLVIGAVRDELTPDELTDQAIVRQAVLRHLAGHIPVVGSMSKAGEGTAGRPLTVALVGPTGVGKTTTIAKLAAAYKLRQGKRVGLITSDTYRIAAVDQLRTYANIIGLPLKVVLTPREMAAACGALADCDVILVDTAGRSQHDTARLGELSHFLEACTPDETHLVLSSAVAESVLLKAAERFSVLGPQRLIISKLDEAVHFGVIVNVLSKVQLRLSFVTTGQEVPDQIELASSDRLARIILDGELAP